MQDINRVSHPSRVRGLKLVCRSFLSSGAVSYPSRVRGLKRNSAQTSNKFSAKKCLQIGRPRRGVRWIETFE